MVRVREGGSWSLRPDLMSVMVSFGLVSRGGGLWDRSAFMGVEPKRS